jgi:hypothetical protein
MIKRNSMRVYEQRLLAVMLALVMVFSLAVFTAPAIAADVEAKVWPTADIAWYTDDPDATVFYIDTAAELFGLAYLVNREEQDEYRTVSFEGKTINLTSNIDLSEHAYSNYTYGDIWNSIGWGTSSPFEFGYCPFKGTFDGNEHTISGFATQPLFGKIIGASVKNLSTSGTVKTGVEGAVEDIAGVVKFAINSILDNLSSNVTLVYEVIAGNAQRAGGIVAQTAGDTAVTNCVFNGVYDALPQRGDYIGGIVGSVGTTGFATNLTVEDCVNYADIDGHYDIGGIVGGTPFALTTVLSANITINDSINYGNISSAGAYAYMGTGGILGASGYSKAVTFPASVTIDGCVNLGNIGSSAINNANNGGIVGLVQQGGNLEISDSYNRGDVISFSDNSARLAVAGGIAGRVDGTVNASISNTYSTGEITATQTVGTSVYEGGFIGQVDGLAYQSVNNYFLNGSAEYAVGGAYSYQGVLAEDDAVMKDPAFAATLGTAYVAVEDDYPILSWQSPEDVRGAIPSWEPATRDTIGVIPSGGGAQRAVFDLVADNPLSGVNLVEATVSYDAELYDVAAVSAVDGATVEIVRNDLAGQVLVVVGVSNETTLGHSDGHQVLAKIAVTPKEGQTPGVAYVKIDSFKAYAAGDVVDLVVNPTAAEWEFTYASDPTDPTDPADPLDVNGDAEITAADLSLALYYFGFEASELPAEVYADTNTDGMVDITDITLLINTLYPEAA